MKKIKLLLDQCFNYQLNFQSWSDKKFVAFLKKLMAGKTEYKIWRINNDSHREGKRERRQSCC